MDLIYITKKFVQKHLKNAEAGHDWLHTERVWKIAKQIAIIENADVKIVELAALLHDIADPKFHNGDEDLALYISNHFLLENQLPISDIEKILYIISHISFKNKEKMPNNPTLELQIVQDADRLDALGAIGIARAFHYGGFKNNLLYDPEIPPNFEFNKNKYTQSNGTTINHFYEKLLLLKDLMNTQTAKKWAEKRHEFMLNFVSQFLKEWNTEDIQWKI